MLRVQTQFQISQMSNSFNFKSLIVDMTLASKIAVYYNLPPVLSQNRCLPEEWDQLPLPRCTSSAQPCFVYNWIRILINFHKTKTPASLLKISYLEFTRIVEQNKALISVVVPLWSCTSSSDQPLRVCFVYNLLWFSKRQNRKNCYLYIGTISGAIWRIYS